ncbi:MAG: hypothetical protein WC554_10045 [Clostridia bacterium]
MARASWVFSSNPYYSATEVDKYLANNPVEFTLLEGQPEYTEYKTNNFEDKVVYRKRYGDPRLVRYHKLQLTYSKMKKEGVDILNTFMRYFGQSIYLRLWQFDAKYDSVKASSTGAVECWPKGDASYYDYFAPYRNLSDDDASLTKVWVNDALVTTGFTIDHDEGKITFTTELDDNDKVAMHFVWRPKVTILNLDPRPIPGQRFAEPRFTPVIVLKEV